MEYENAGKSIWLGAELLEEVLLHQNNMEQQKQLISNEERF
jgi:hypothetical protein